MPILSYKEHGLLFLSSQIQKKVLWIHLGNCSVVPYTRLSNQDAPMYAVKETPTLLAFIHLKKTLTIKLISQKFVLATLQTDI